MGNGALRSYFQLLQSEHAHTARSRVLRRWVCFTRWYGVGGPGGRQLPGGFEPPNGADLPGGGQLPGRGQFGNDQPGGASGQFPDRRETTNPALAALLKATDTKWAAAAVGSQSAAPLELSSGTAVMAIGGFSGSDPAPALAQLTPYVSAGKVRYFVVVGGFGGGRGGDSDIASWVESHFTARSVGGRTVYDLSNPK